MRTTPNGWGILMQDDIDAMLEGHTVQVPLSVARLMLHADVVERMKKEDADDE